jgi:circadian clock protein KaiB
MTPRSRQAIDNVRRLCEDHLAGRHDLEIIDIYQQPDLAQDAQVIAAPTLVKSQPPPHKRVIGDLEEVDRVLSMLGLANGEGKKQ